MPDQPLSETDEQEHTHVCPVCMDGWKHACRDCEPVYGAPIQSWAKCPEHEGMSRDDF